MNTLRGILAAIACLGILASGCAPLVAAGAGVAVGAAAVTYTEGELRTTYNAPYDRTWNAALQAYKDMNIAVYNSSKDAGLIEGTRPDGNTVRTILSRRDANTTAASIRVGTLGDEKYSTQLSQQITKDLTK